MESPSSILYAMNFALAYLAYQEDYELNEFFWVPFFLLLLWESHYIQRTFIWPLCVIKEGGGKMNVLVMLFGTFLNTINAYLCSTFITRKGVYPLSYFYDPRLILGTIVFITGYYINRKSDSMLAQLRKPSGEAVDTVSIENKYKIPYGFLYEYVSCPNYLGEIIIWLG